MNVLIPRYFPGKFYYPPCKCELMNQVRYYNPKTREFYYHKAYPAISPHQANNKDVDTSSNDGATLSPADNPQIPILAGEPEFFLHSTVSPDKSAGYGGSQLQAPALSFPYPYPPPASYYKPYPNHVMVICFKI